MVDSDGGFSIPVVKRDSNVLCSIGSQMDILPPEKLSISHMKARMNEDSEEDSHIYGMNATKA
jgi:hypothetical protein